MAKMTASIPSNASYIERLNAVKVRTGLSRSTIYKMMSEGKFPASMKLGERAVGWKSSDVTDWIESRSSTAGA